MNTITLDDSTYNDISSYAKRNGITIAEALKSSVQAFLANFKGEQKTNAEQSYYISPKVKALEASFKCPEDLSSNYREELSQALTEKYL